MAKSKSPKLSKLPKWAWWGLWLLGVLASLFMIFYAVFQIWVSTWQTYRNDEFGFSIKYPKSWIYKAYKNPDVVVLSSSWNVSYQDPGLPESPGFLTVDIMDSEATDLEKKVSSVLNAPDSSSGVRYLGDNQARLWALEDDAAGIPTEYFIYSDRKNVYSVIGAVYGNKFSFKRAFHYLIVREMVASIKFEKK